MNSLEWGTLLAQHMAWETDSSESSTGWVTWGVCFLLAVIAGGMSILLRPRRPDPSRSVRERLSEVDRCLQRQSSPVSPIAQGVWIGTLEFEPRTPADLLRLIPLRISVDDGGEARAVHSTDMGDEHPVVAVRWETSDRDSDRWSTLTIALAGADGRSQTRLSMRRESQTWVTAPGAAGPSLRLRRTTKSVRRPSAA